MRRNPSRPRNRTNKKHRTGPHRAVQGRGAGPKPATFKEIADLMTEITPTDPITISTEELTPLKPGEPDERFAGTPLDTWLGYEPLDGVIRATEVAIASPGVRIMAFNVAQPFELTKRFIDQQRRAFRAYVAEHHDTVKGLRLGSTTAPFRGVGPDVRVVFVVLKTAKKVETAHDG